MLIYWMTKNEKRIWPFYLFIFSRNILLSFNALFIMVLFTLFSFIIHQNPFVYVHQCGFIFFNFLLISSYLDKIEFDKYNLEKMTLDELKILQEHYLTIFRTFFVSLVLGIIVLAATTMASIGIQTNITRTIAFSKISLIANVLVLIWCFIGGLFFITLLIKWDALQKIKKCIYQKTGIPKNSPHTHKK